MKTSQLFIFGGNLSRMDQTITPQRQTTSHVAYRTLGVITLGILAAGVVWASVRPRHPGNSTVEVIGSDHNTIATATPPGASTSEFGWPNLLGPQHNSTSSEFGLNPVWPATGPRVVWRASIGEGYSSPVAEGDDLVVFHRPVKDSVASIPDDLQPGEVNHGPDEVVSCFAAATGKPRWEFRHPTNYRCKTHYSSGPYATPILAGNYVYACGTEGNLYCLQRSDGTLVWNRELWKDYGLSQQGFFPVTGSPLLTSGRLILNLGAKDVGAGIIALDAATGETLWQTTDHDASYATPCAATIHGREFVFVFTPQGLVALDPQTGSQYWEVKFRANNPEFVNATSPIVVGDIVFVSGHALGSLCLQIQPDGSYRELWRDKRRNFDSQYNPLVAADGCIFGFAALDDTFRCIELKTGALRWKGLRELERGAMIAADGHFFILGTQGNLASARLDSRELTVVSQTKEPVFAAPSYSFPALHRGLLYVRNEREVAALDLRK